MRLQDLGEALHKILAWESIVTEKQALNLSPFEAKQAETQKQAADGAVTPPLPPVDLEKGTGRPLTPAPSSTETRPSRFFGTVHLDPTRVGRDASRVAEEVIAHLAGQPDAEVTVTIEIEAKLPNGVSEQLLRTVSENSRTLKFRKPPL